MYSRALREKVLSLRLERGWNFHKIADLFEIHLRTAQRWNSQQNREGSVHPEASHADAQN